MALRGSLDDVPVVDVLQFVHLSGKSGTLILTAGSASGLVEFVDGNIVFARASMSRTLGGLLVARGLLDEARLNELLTLQASKVVRPPLGRMIVEEGLASEEVLAGAVRDQIQEAMIEIASWRQGEFQFHQSRIEPIDDVRVDVEDLLPSVGMNTQFFLLEAMRLVDERLREGPSPARPESAPAELLTPPEAPAAAVVLETGTRLEPAPGDSLLTRTPAVWAEPTLPPLDALSTRRGRGRGAGVLPVGLDRPTLEVFASALAAHGYPVLGHVPSRHVTEQFLGTRPWPHAMVLLWRIRGGVRGNAEESLAHLQQTLKLHPGWTIIALVSGDVELVASAYAAGAQAVVPVRDRGAPSEMLVSAVESVVERIWRDNRREADAQAGEMRGWLQATRLTSEMHRAAQRATVALDLMRVAAQVLDRAILFLSKGDTLIGLGAFGLTADGRSMAEAMRGLAIELKADTTLARSLETGAAVVGAPGDFGMGRVFFEIAGMPAANRAVLIPLAGPTRSIGILYGDNGQLHEPLRGVQAVELASAQAGMAYENEALRRRLDGRAEPA